MYFLASIAAVYRASTAFDLTSTSSHPFSKRS